MPKSLTTPITGTPVWYFAAAPPAAAPLAAVVTQSLAGRPVSIATTGITWANGVATVTLASAVSDPIGSNYPITVAGVTPGGYNGSYAGTITSSTTVSYPLASNPGAVTVQGTVAYNSGFDLTGQNVPFFNLAQFDASAGTITARNGIGFYYGQRPASGAWCTMPRINEPVPGAWPSNQEALSYAEHDLSPSQKEAAADKRIADMLRQAQAQGQKGKEGPIGVAQPLYPHLGQDTTLLSVAEQPATTTHAEAHADEDIEDEEPPHPSRGRTPPRRR